MLADRIRMCVNLLSKKDDPLGSIGPQDLILGDMMAGYFGTVNNLVTNTQLTNLMGMTAGTLTDPANTDIVLYKFAHKGRVLFIPYKAVKYNISWDNIQSRDGVKGKAINIGGNMYLCRLMTGSKHYYTGNPSIAGGEYNDLIVDFIHLTNIAYGYKYVICQDINSADIDYRVIRGYYNLTNWGYTRATTAIAELGWWPILEVL